MRRKKTKSSLTSSITRPATVLRRQCTHQNKSSSNTQATSGPNSNNATLNKKWIEDLKKDKTIFRPSGRIVFPRSDGLAKNRLQSVNTRTPGPNETEYDYYSVCEPNDADLVDLKKKCGQKIAEMLDLNPKIDWRLHSLRERYKMVLHHVKRPSEHARDEVYVLGSKQAWTGFRSANEFAAHALWLLRDATLDQKNCTCPYCLPTRDQWQQETAQLVGKTLVPPTNSRQAFRFEAQADVGPSAPGRANAANGVFKSAGKVAAASHAVNTLTGTGTSGCPITVDDDSSDEEDDHDEVDEEDDGHDAQPPPQAPSYPIGCTKAPKDGILPGVAPDPASERTEEFDNLAKSKPGRYEGYRRGEYVFCSLPAPITNHHLGENARIDQWPAIVKEVMVQIKERVDLTKGPKAKAEERIVRYDVRFLGSHDSVSVDSDRLQPGLLCMHSVRKLFNLVFESGTVSSLDDISLIHVANEHQRSSWHRLALMYLLQAYTCRVLCLAYVLTNPFQHNMPADKALTTTLAIASTGQQGSTDPPTSSPSNYAAFERKDDSRRASRTLPLQSVAASARLAADTKTYWQGMYLGLERIWVGDVVRLRLTRADVDAMFKVLKEHKHLFNPDDQEQPDLGSPFVVRVKAIYRGRNEEQVRVAGDVFRIIDKAEADRRNDERRAKSGSGMYLTVSAKPCLASSNDNQLPASPHLGHNFGFQRVNQGNSEVIFVVDHLAGRLYPHLSTFAGRQSDRQRERMIAEARRHFLQGLTSSSSETARDHLCMAGLIPGFFKAMEVNTANCSRSSSESAYYASHETAVGTMKKLLQEASDRAMRNRPQHASRRHADRMDVDQDFDVSRASEDTTASNETSSTLPSSDGGHDAELEQIQSTLPPGWTVHRSTSLGKLYYGNADEGRTQWHCPY